MKGVSAGAFRRSILNLKSPPVAYSDFTALKAFYYLFGAKLPKRNSAARFLRVTRLLAEGAHCSLVYGSVVVELGGKSLIVLFFF